MNTRYQHVNDQWPEHMPVPTGPEAITAVKRLYRLVMGRAYRGKFKLTSGRRYTWVRNGVYYVNPEGHHFKGWRDLVHDVSHRCHWRLDSHKKDYKPHDHRHHFLERTMVAHVIKSGWLEGKLKRAPRAAKAAPTPLAKIEAGIKRWQTKKKRAETALKKLERRRKYYLRKSA